MVGDLEEIVWLRPARPGEEKRSQSALSPLRLLSPPHSEECRPRRLLLFILRVFNNPPALSDYNVRPPTLVLFLEPGQQSIVAKALRLQARGCVVRGRGAIATATS